MAADAFLGFERGRDGPRFELGDHLRGAFGGIFGGAVAACAVRAARDVVPERRPASLDIRFLRGLPPGTAEAQASVLHAGRSLTTVRIDLVGERRLAASATLGLVDPAALHPLDRPASRSAPDEPDGEGSAWRVPDGVEAPIVDTLGPRIVRADDEVVVTAVRAPWLEQGAGAEVACLAADMCVGPPVAAATRGEPIPHPNPDLSLRFAAEPLDTRLIAVGRLERVDGGLATVGIEVWSSQDLVAAGVSSSILLAG
jgi:acyl-coenzyme A thioesterase PaaI-like protein